jgi:hypothetical protein
MKSVAYFTAVSLLCFVGAANANPGAASTAPYVYAKGEISLVANPNASKMDTAAHAGASMEPLLISGKGEAGAIINAKAVQSLTMQSNGQFKAVPGEVALQALKAGDHS